MPIIRPKDDRKPQPPAPPPEPVPQPAPAPEPAQPAPSYVIGSYGNASIDQHDALFVAASDAVEQKKSVRVDPRVLKAMMEVEARGDGNYPVDRCRPYDGHPGPRSCGPMQIKWKFHEKRCSECNQDTVAGHIEMAFHIIADTMRDHNCDEYEAYVRGYLTSDDINGTTQQAAKKKLQTLVAKMEANAAPSKPVPAPTPTPKPDPWRHYPYPKMVDLIVQKPGEGAGFTRCAFRRPLIRGFCTHITDGPPSQTIEFFRDFFGTGGARAWDALTDLVIGWDGRIGLLNDWRDPQRGGTRAGWANGSVDGLEEDGVAFYRRFPDINVHLVSCEHTQKAGGQWSDAMLASTIEIRTAIAQELKIPAADYPNHRAWGTSIELQHREFATKSCPAEPYISTYNSIVLREVKKKQAAWQGGAVVAPQPEPMKRYTDYGFTLAQVADYFGVLDRVNENGTVDRLPFDPKGPISLSWLRRCEREGRFPEAEEVRLWDATVGKGKAWFATFEGGWVLFKPAGDTRADWAWLDEVERARAAHGGSGV